MSTFYFSMGNLSVPIHRGKGRLLKSPQHSTSKTLLVTVNIFWVEAGDRGARMGQLRTGWGELQAAPVPQMIQAWENEPQPWKSQPRTGQEGALTEQQHGSLHGWRNGRGLCLLFPLVRGLSQVEWREEKWGSGTPGSGISLPGTPALSPKSAGWTAILPSTRVAIPCCQSSSIEISDLDNLTACKHLKYYTKGWH